ncbi:isochorismatase hydrolase [Obelidium mucronatum]|nr:isochorismatase hydrolase [Obelidium mucronatum]
MTLSQRPALLVVDLQVAFFELDGAEGGPIANAGALLGNTQTLLAAFRRAKLPVAFVRHDGDGGFAPQSAGWPVAPELAQRGEAEEPTFAKSEPDAFSNPRLHAWLTEARAAQLVVVGAQTDFCIDGTTRGALKLGWDVVVVADTHSTYDNGAATASELVAKYNALFVEAGASVMDMESVLDALYKQQQ